MESKVQTVDTAISQTKLLRKKLTKSRTTICHLKILSVLLFAGLIVLFISFMNQQKQIDTLQKNYSDVKTKYNEVVESYTKLSAEYAELRAELKDKEMIEDQSAEFEEGNNIVLTDTLVQYSNMPSEFVYNSDIPLSEDIQKYAYNKCQESGIDYYLIPTADFHNSEYVKYV